MASHGGAALRSHHAYVEPVGLSARCQRKEGVVERWNSKRHGASTNRAPREHGGRASSGISACMRKHGTARTHLWGDGRSGLMEGRLSAWVEGRQNDDE
jgi:hypothetical protein